VTKKSDALAKKIASEMPNFLSAGSFLYRKEPILMMRGFALDMPPGTCYIWKYYIPLFESVDFLNMSLGYRLSEGHIETGGKDAAQLASEASRIVLDNDDFSDDETLEELIRFANDRRVAPTERARLFRELDCFKSEPLETILNRAAANREKLGIA
jgi:hypothetical protein